MRIGLIDADLMWQKRTNGRRYGKTKTDIFPNLALMKLSAWHKRQGDDVEWYFGLKHYDRVYVSKVFSTTPETADTVNANAQPMLFKPENMDVEILLMPQIRDDKLDCVTVIEEQEEESWKEQRLL